MMRKNKSQRLFQSLRSLRFKKNRSADDAAKKSGRVVLMDTHSVTKPAQVAEHEVKAESRIALQEPVAPQEEPTCYVRCPLGLEAGNTMMVISPCGTHKFAVKIPKGVVCGQEFQVRLPQAEEEGEQQEQEDKQEGGLDYVFRVVDEFLTPTPSFEEGEPQPAKEQQEAAPVATETKVLMSQDFGSALDSFFTPVPEVKAYFHAAQA